MTDHLDTDLAQRFGEIAVSELLELHPSADKPAASKAAQRTGRRVAREQVWDATANVRGVLGPGKALTAEEICRQTGLMPEQCGAALCKLEGEGVVRREGGGWRMVFG